MGKKGDTAGQKKKKQPPPPVEENQEEEEEEKPTIDDIEKNIVDLREKAKEDPESVDYSQELRKIQDQIADMKGEQRRPKTAKPGEVEEEEEEEEEEDEEDPDKEVKELINKRLTSCMLLALSFECEESYPVDFYEKLSQSAKLNDVTQPFTKEETKILNDLLKEKKPEAKKRVKKAEKNLKKLK